MRNGVCRQRPRRSKRSYSLDEVKAILAILEPLNLPAAVAVAMAYFVALRPAEIRLEWGRLRRRVCAYQKICVERSHRAQLNGRQCRQLSRKGQRREKAPKWGDFRFNLDN